jgi:hypothetical protein
MLNKVQLNSFTARKEYPSLQIAAQVMKYRQQLQIELENSDLDWEQTAIYIEDQIAKKFGHLLTIK